MLSLRIHRTTGSIALVALVIGAALALGSCAATQQSNLWMDPSYHSAPMKKVLVIAVRKNQLGRRMWEDALVSAVGDKQHPGTVAVASYQLYGEEIPDTLAVREKTLADGFDGVLLVARAQRDTLTSNVPGYMASEPVTTYNRRWNAYVTRYEDVYHMGYSETETTVSVRVDLLVPQEDGKLVWSVTSQSVDPTSAAEFRSSVADRVASQLKKSRIIH
jgi:hypothetical protein